MRRISSNLKKSKLIVVEQSKDLIAIKELLETIRIIHITDSHVSVLSKNEKEYHPYSRRMDKAFKSSASFIYESLKATDIPYIYIAGNHDWRYEGMEGSSERLRQTWINNRLLPLYGGITTLYSSRVIGGINFVAIDNSIYQVNEDQLHFVGRRLPHPNLTSIFH